MPKLPGLLLCLLVFLILVPGYQFFYCYSTTQGDPSGLFFTGGLQHHVPELEARTYYYADSYGYDGQMYRILAHDPLLRQGMARYMDDPGYRSRRMLIPVLAGGIGTAMSGLLGSDAVRTVDMCYILLLDALLAWGCWYFIRLTTGYCPAWLAATLYCLVPAVMASADRMVLDGSGAAGFAAAMVLYREKRHGALLAVLTLLALTRETNVVITAGIFLAYCGVREYRRAAAVAATMIPLAAWATYAGTRTPPSGAWHLLSYPLVPHIVRLLTPVVRPVSAGQNLVFQIVDAVTLLCLLAALTLFVRLAWRALRQRDWPDEVWMVLPAAILTALSSHSSILAEPYAFMRVNSVLLTWAAWQVLLVGQAWGGAYVLLCTVGIAMFRISALLRFVTRL